MAVYQAIQLALTFLSCALLGALVLEVRRARRARAENAAAVRQAITAVNDQQIAHRDALVHQISAVLHEVMNATEPRTVVIGPQANDAPRPPGRPDLRVVPPPDEEPPEPGKR